MMMRSVLALAVSAPLLLTSNAVADSLYEDPVPKAPFPTKVAGFAFGLTVSQLKAACDKGNGYWGVEVGPNPKSALCTKPSTDMPFDVGLVQFKLCDGRICEISVLVLGPENTGDHGARLTGVRNWLVRKYGDPSSQMGAERPVADLPGMCATKLATSDKALLAKLEEWNWFPKKPTPQNIGRAGQIQFGYSCVDEESKTVPDAKLGDVGTLRYINGAGLRARIMAEVEKRQNF